MPSSFLQPQTLAAMNAEQYSYPFEFTIEAGSGGSPGTEGSEPIAIQGGIPFFTDAVYIDFPTTYQNDETVEDDGVCRLTLLLKANQSIQLMAQAVQLNLIAVPGRQTVAGVSMFGGGDLIPGQAPHIDGKEWHTYLPGGSKFFHNFQNFSNVAAVVHVLWTGWSLDASIDSADMFWATVKKHQDLPAAH